MREMTQGNSKTGWNTLLLFVCGVVLAGLMPGYANTPGDWYAALNRHAFNPPNYVFALLWLVPYVCKQTIVRQVPDALLATIQSSSRPPMPAESFVARRRMMVLPWTR
ncbi:tryptophan-rich sensory protein [Bradyrhizobium sp.]|uniref:tryptophan-rich sensory protein n=1 Tax=Bradyrhizobium sp. TaxID=376 RepID=UPI001E137BB9|nr:tryptophan-rich sensory protein [Bradyrhizobium sp.]MBI5321321.1 tryptophan-rich sensory protein [Bradyrhizobium sp.]